MKKIKTILTAITLVASTWLAKGQTTYTPCTGFTCSTNTASPCEYVCNGGGETKGGSTNGYPTDYSQVDKACGWFPLWSSSTFSYSGACFGSFAFTTPDFYYKGAGTNSGSPNLDIPCNGNGVESERTGNNGYFGFFAYTRNNSHDPLGCWVEGLGTKLTTTLTPGSIYRVTYYISLSDNSNLNTNDNVGFVVYNSANPYGTASTYTFASGTSTVSRTGWTQLTMTFTATNNEDILGVGAMFITANTTSATSSSSTCSVTTTPAQSAYYYIDDISLTLEAALIASAPITSGCTGESFTLTASGASTYTWYPGAITGTSVVVTPTATTIYTVTGTGTNSCVYTPTTITISTYTCCANPNANNITFRNVNLVPNGTSGALPWSSLTAGGYYTGNIAVPPPSSGTSLITNTLSIVNGFSINANVTFSVCNVSMTETVAISQYSTTTITNSYLWGCDKLWTGIQTKGQLTITNSWIEDAFVAIDCGSYFTGIATHPGITVDNVMFNKNYNCITLGSTSMLPGNLHITGNLFSCRSFGVPDYTTTTRYNSLFPNPGIKVPARIKGSAYYSITANTIRSNFGIVFGGITSATTTPDYFIIGNVDGNSTVNATYTNRFDFMNDGIVNMSGRVYIFNNIFSNMINLSLGTTNGAIWHANVVGTGTVLTKVGSASGTYPASSYKNVFNTVKDGVAASIYRIKRLIFIRLKRAVSC